MSTDPTIELARQTLKRLTTRRLPPTPENYARVYAEVSGRTAADFTDPQPLATLLIKTLEDSVSKDLLGQVRVNRVRQLVHDQDWERIPALLLQHLNQSIEQQIAGQHWGELVQDLIRHWDLRQPGLTTDRIERAHAAFCRAATTARRAAPRDFGLGPAAVHQLAWRLRR